MNTELINQYDAHLVFTGVTRNSKNVLKDVTANIEKSKPLLETVERAHDAFMNKNYYVDCKVNAEKRYREIYDVPSIIKKFIELYKEVVS